MRFFHSSLALSLTFGLINASHALSLQQAMQSAIDYHPAVQSSINARLAAEAQLQAAQGAYKPKIDIVAGYGREDSDNSTTRSEGYDWRAMSRRETRIQLQQMLYDGQATDHEVGRHLATVDAKAYRVRTVAEQTALNAADVYIDVLKRQKFVQLSEQSLKHHQQIYAQIKSRSDQGIGRLADLDQIEARLAQARNNLITEQTNLIDAQANFLSIVGKAADNLDAPNAVNSALPENLDKARRELLDNHPQLQSAEADIEAAHEQYQAAKSNLSPKIRAELSHNADNNLDGALGASNAWQAMVYLSYNLYSGGAHQADIEAKAYQANEAQDIRNTALRTLNEELSLSWNALRNARQQLPVLKQQASYSERVRNSYQQQFSIGERTLLDLLDSENELLSVQYRIAEVEATKLFSQYRTLAATGQLLKAMHVVAPLSAITEADTPKPSPVRLPELP